jgi:AcrR family transcriptional regulator
MHKANKARPRTKAPEVRREEIMNAAQKLFLKRGVAPTTIEEITLAADVAKGTFYLYFKSKEDVLAALEERFSEELLKGIKAALAEREEEDWKGQLAAWASAFVNGYLGSIELHDIIFHGNRPAKRGGLVTENVTIEHLYELLREGVEAKAWSLEDPHLTAVFLFSGVHGVVDEAYGKEKSLHRGRLVGRVEEIFFRAVGLRR